MTDAATEPTSELTTEPIAPPADLAELGARLDDEVARLDSELGEVDLLITQARTEAARHESRRSARGRQARRHAARRQRGRSCSS